MIYLFGVPRSKDKLSSRVSRKFVGGGVMKFLLCLRVLVALSICTCCNPEVRAQSAASPAPPASVQDTPTQVPQTQTIAIPGPLRSFLRVAAISQKISADEIAPLLARNIFLLGYEGP